jgi:hypothetical protein
MEEDFSKVFSNNRIGNRSMFSENIYSMDIWHGCLSLARQFLRGWSSNKIAEEKKGKVHILARLGELDQIGEQGSMDVELWMERYMLEARLEHIFHKEEIFWQQRGSERWMIKGDANTSFFSTRVQLGGEGRLGLALSRLRLGLLTLSKRLRHT